MSFEKSTDNLSSKKEVPENVSIIETPSGRFRVIYGNHSKEQSAEDLGNNYGCLILESGEGNYTTPGQAEVLLNGAFRNDVQYKKLIQLAERDKKPIFFVDVPTGTVADMLYGVVSGAETGVGAALLGMAINDLLTNKKMSRRQFIKSIGKSVVGGYLVSSLAADLLAVSASQNNTKKIIGLQEKIHPETHLILFTLRNYLMAQKLETLTRKYQEALGDKEIALVVGRLHTGIEECLRLGSPERVDAIRKMLTVPLPNFDMEKVSKITRLDFSKKDGQWETTDIFDDPILAETLGIHPRPFSEKEGRILP